MSRIERRSFGRLAVVLWFGVCAVVVVGIGLSTLGAAGIDRSAGPSATAADRAVQDRSDVSAEPGGRTARTGRAEGIIGSYFPGADFSMDFDRGSGLDVRLGTGSIDVSFFGLGGGDGRQTGTITHGAIDGGIARSSGAGLCAVGLQGDDSPVALDVDGENASVSADLASRPVDNETRTSPTEPGAVVRSCANRSAR